jgi:hypothetical protein
MYGIDFSQDFLAEWLIAPELFERRFDPLAGNDNTAEDSPGEEDLPGVSRLSFY